MGIMFKTFLAVLLGALLLASCGEKEKQELVGTHNYEDREFTILVKVHDNNRELNKAIAKNFKVPEATREGFANWVISADMKDMDICTIHVVRPKHADDEPELMVWGHELAHCIYGTYHKE